jgi:uncharacterized protein YjbI with pentapeptide repeats
MNQEETIALFERCEAARVEATAAALAQGKPEPEVREVAQETAKAVWNDWASALLDERKALEEAGQWAARRRSYGDFEAYNEATRKWLDAARADFSMLRFVMRLATSKIRLELGEVKSRPAAWQPGSTVAVSDEEINFSGFIFPGTADFQEAQFTVAARFEGAQFAGDARFRGAQCSVNARFHEAQFAGEAQFHDAKFFGRSWFSGAQFKSNADFEKAEFSLEAWFDEAQFHGPARFRAAQFAGEARFHKAQFLDSAEFNDAQFESIAWFDKTQFAEKVRFDKAQFSGNTWFHEAHFASEAWFRDARFFAADFQKAEFTSEVRFHQARFTGDTDFRGAQFGEEAWFWNTDFSGDADFEKAQFRRTAWFNGARFGKSAVFTQTGFGADVFFVDAHFVDTANFQLTKFPAFTSFQGAHFEFRANFNAIHGGLAFDLTDATFDAVPEFIQAHFEEPPRLDNLTVRERLVMGARGFGPSTFWRRRWSYPLRVFLGVMQRVFRADRNVPARWRAMKRLAMQARDQDREHEFFTREIQGARFAGDWPLPLRFWQAGAWLGFVRFWFALFYALFSNYGRSVILPVLWWIGAAAIGAMFYLGEHDGMEGRRAALERNGTHWTAAYLQTSYEAWRIGEPCDIPGAERVGLGALSPAVREATSAPREALDLALRTGFVVLDPVADNARRSFGCLFGVERFGDTVAPVVPSAVSYMMVAQKLFSALMIFLFALALRNMLKMH